MLTRSVPNLVPDWLLARAYGSVAYVNNRLRLCHQSIGQRMTMFSKWPVTDLESLS